MRKLMLVILISWILPLLSFAQQPTGFKEVDQSTLELYEAGNWEKLVTVAKEALKQGIDYFYLRVRTGIAYYYLGNYRQAEIHLQQALEFNPYDPTTIEYLYYSYLMQNKGAKAISLLSRAQPSLQKYLSENTPPRQNLLHLDAGIFLSNQANQLENYDLDGKDDLYGETDIFNRATYLSLGGRWFPSGMFSLYAAYTYLLSDKTKLISTDDAEVLREPIKVHQHQLYLSGTLYTRDGISITPAVHFLNVTFNSFKAELDPQDGSFNFSDTSISLSNYIGLLSLQKDFRIIKAGISGALANLNEKDQVQAGFDITAYPLGNLDLYLYGRFTAHFNDSNFQPVLHAMAGGRILKPIWLEFSGAFGKVENYFEKNASAVYNFPDKMRFRYEVKMIATLTNRINLVLDYQYIGKEADVLTYLQKGNDEIVPELHPKNYIDQFIIASLQWKL